jgi:hypothetical protein
MLSLFASYTPLSYIPIIQISLLIHFLVHILEKENGMHKEFIVHIPYFKKELYVLMLESVRTEMTTSQGYKSPCIFIEVVFLFVSRFSWNSRFFKII